MPATITNYPIPMSRDDLMSSSPLIAPLAALGLPLLAVNPRDTPAPATEKDQDWRKAPRDLRTDAERDAAPIPGKGWQASTLDAATWDTWMHRYDAQSTRTPLNVGVVPGPSVHGGGIMVIDVDDEAEHAALDRLWRTWTGEDAPPLTVHSPGVHKTDEGWTHKNGGHLYLHYTGTLPDGLGTTLDISSESSKVTVKLRNTYLLAPPSVRAEGPYRWGENGDVPEPAPVKLLGYIAGQAAQRSARRTAHTGAYQPDAAVAEWAEQYDWSRVLPDAGFTLTGSDSCRCPIWMRDGGSSPKSATAHESGCALSWDEPENAPLHLWSDGDYGPLGTWSASEGTKRISKLRAVALTFHGGSMRAARAAEGIAGSARRTRMVRTAPDGTTTEVAASTADTPTWTPMTVPEKIIIPTGPAVLVGLIKPAEESEDDEGGYVEPDAPARYGLTRITVKVPGDPTADPRAWHIPVYPTEILPGVA